MNRKPTGIWQIPSIEKHVLGISPRDDLFVQGVSAQSKHRLVLFHPLLMTAVVWLLMLPSAVLCQSSKHIGFEEKPDLFKMRRLPSTEDKGFDRLPRIRWRSDSELVVNSFQYRDRRGEGGWGQHTLLWNIDTDTVAQLPYVGAISCLSEDRIVLRRDVRESTDSAVKKLRIEYLGAVFGEPATKIESGSYNKFTCEAMERNVAGDFGQDTSLVVLRPGDGRVLFRTKPGSQHAWFLPANGAERKSIGAGIAAHHGEYVLGPDYLPWLKSYLLMGASGDHSVGRTWGNYDIALYILSPDGKIERQVEPEQINRWKKNPNGPSVPSHTVTRAGTIWGMEHHVRGWPHDLAGLYMERNGHLVRFLRNARIAQIHVSPSGCRGLVDVDPAGRNFQLGERTDRYLVEFCEERKS